MDRNPCTTRLFDQNFGMCISPEDIILPFYNFYGKNYYRPWKLFTEAKKDFGSTIDITENRMKVTLDVHLFRPNEISVKVNDREIFIEGKHEERQDDHGFISRQFTRRYNLPKDCRSETVSSTLSSDGVLTVTANKDSNTQINEKARVVPIEMSGPCPQKEAESKSEPYPETVESLVTLGTKKVKEDAKSACSKKGLQKEDHCRLLKSDFLSEAVSSTEKLLSDSRKETDELLKLISSDTSAKATTSSASEKLEEVYSGCKSTIAELTEKATESASEFSCLKNSMIAETFDSQATSSSISKSSMSTQSSVKSTSGTMSEIICAELKEAAENV